MTPLEEALSDASRAFAVWSMTPVRVRVEHLAALRRAYAADPDGLAQIIADECGRPIFEVLTQELIAAAEHGRYVESESRRWFAPRVEHYPRPGFFGARPIVERIGFGPVGLVTPANFPFSLAVMAATLLLAAGNTVVLKPSERRPQSNARLRRLFDEAGLLGRAIWLVEGDMSTAQAIAEDPRIEKLFFFGGHAAANALEEICAQRRKPCVLEAGGGTVAIVLDAAIAPAAARAIVWAGTYAGGESCIGISRVLVQEQARDALQRSLQRELESRRADPAGSLVRVSASTLGTIRKRAADMERVGHGSLLEPWVERASDLEDTSWVGPSIVALAGKADEAWLTSAPKPLVLLASYHNDDEALELALRARPLGVSVWSSERSSARALAGRFPLRMRWVNETSVALPHLPWGGAFAPDRGALFSEHALDAVSRARWILERSPTSLTRRPWWYPYTPLKERIARWTLRWLGR